MLIFLISQKEHSTIWLITVASAGNILGSCITYGMGRIANEALHRRRWVRFQSKHLEKAESWFFRFGTPTLLLAWLPIIGDPICLVAGVLRCHILSFLLWVSLGKIARYAFLAYLVSNY